MPIYEYQCKSCGHQLEAIQGFNDAPLTECPECHKPDLNKLLSAPAFHLKGTGWYATDFKNPQNTAKQAASTTSEGDKASASTTTTSQETKKTDEKAD